MTIAFLLMLPMSMQVSADEPASNTEEGDDDVGMSVSKRVNVQDDGTYIVDLEAFATGTVSFSEETVPVDLILVLDVSGSMSDNFTDEEYEYTALNSAAYSYDSYGNNTYYYLYNGNYYQVSRQRTGDRWDRRYNLHFEVPGWPWSTTYYLSGTGITTTNPETSGRSSTIWSGVLYTRTTVPAVTKISALHTAVNNFIDVVAQKNQETIDHNTEAGVETTNADLSRVALVKFAGNSRNGTNYQNYQNNIGNETYRDGNWTNTILKS